MSILLVHSVFSRDDCFLKNIWQGIIHKKSIKHKFIFLPGDFRCTVGLLVIILFAVDLEAPLFVLGGATGG